MNLDPIIRKIGSLDKRCYNILPLGRELEEIIA